MATATRTVRSWPKQTHVGRAIVCQRFLRIHGYLTDAENKKVKQRIMKAVK